MATTWDTVDDMLLHMLDDIDAGEFSVEARRVDAWNWAQRHYVHHTPRQRVQEKLIVDSRKVILPSDFYEMGRLYDPVNKCWWQQQQWQPGGSYDKLWETQTYSMWGGTLYLYDDVSSTNSFELWYYAYWPDVVYRTVDSVIEEDKVLVPAWAEGPLVHLATAFCLNPQAVEAAKTRQWNIRIDSGRPTDNSRAVQTRELLWWYNTLVGAYPPLDRGGH